MKERAGIGKVGEKKQIKEERQRGNSWVCSSQHKCQILVLKHNKVNMVKGPIFPAAQS